MSVGKMPKSRRKVGVSLVAVLTALMGMMSANGGIDREFFETAPGKSDCFTIIELTLFPGRTKEQKRAVIEGITEKLHGVLAIPKEDIFIIINEPPLENWGLGGKQK